MRRTRGTHRAPRTASARAAGLLLVAAVALARRAAAQDVAPAAPLRDAAAGPAAARTSDAPDFADVAAVLAARCTGCHGETRDKGGLRLHDAESIAAGGDSGAVVVAGDPAASELLRRVELDESDEDHMPPRGKPQPEASERALLRRWIAGGASFESRGGPATVTAESGPPVVPDAAAVRRLRDERVHVETDDPRTGLLWVSCVPRPDVTPAQLGEWLSPLRDAVVELSLAGCAVGDDALPSVTTLARLERLDLSRTRVTSAGLRALADAPALAVLNLVGTRLDASAVDALAALPALRRVALFDAGLSDDDLGRLAARRPALALRDGRAELAEPRDAEGEIVLGPRTAAVSAPSDAALAAARAEALRPVNARCPVSGSPVDPRFVVVHDGQAVGFCCPDCPESFWDDPAAFPSRD